MAASTRLSVVLGFKAPGAIPKVLYLGYDADEAKAALETAKDKGYYELKVCKGFDAFFIARWRAELVPALK